MPSKNKLKKYRKGYAPKWMNPKNHVVGEHGVHYNLTLPKATTKEEARRMQSTVRRALHHELYTHMLNAKNGMPGFDAYQVSSAKLANRLRFDRVQVASAARLWRSEFGFETNGHKGGVKTGTKISPQDIAFTAWYDSASRNRVIVLSDLVKIAGKQGVLITPKTLAYWIADFNKYLDKKAWVKVNYGELKRKSSVADVRKFLTKENITGARSSARFIKD